MAPPFEPLWLLRNRHLQTLAGAFSFPLREPRSTQCLVELPDGDRLSVEVSTPAEWTPKQPTVLMVHGLTGSHRSAYMIRLTNKFMKRSWRAARINLRGSGSGFGLARKPYTGGCSEDILAVAERFAQDGSPLILVGFSLGGNIVLKLAGDLGERGPELFREVLAYCPATDLEACYHRMRAALGRAYERFFVGEMGKAIRARNAVFPDDPHEIPKTKSLWEFDDQYTARLWGYDGASDYYARASAKPLLGEIAVPTRITIAEDDPVICPEIYDGLTLPDAVTLNRVPAGGHLGFLAKRKAGGVQWMDRHVLHVLGG